MQGVDPKFPVEQATRKLCTVTLVLGEFKSIMPKNTKKQQKKRMAKKLATDIQAIANSRYAPPQTRKQMKNDVKGLQLGKCSLKLLKLIKDPFSARDICMAAGQSPPSFKVRSYANLTLTANANGYTYIYASPVAASDAPAYFYLQNGVDGSNYSGGVPIWAFDSGALSANDATQKGVIANLPYQSANFDASSSRESSVIGRVIALSMRIRYVGTELNKAGKVIAYCSPNNNRVDRYDPSTIRTLQGATVSPVTKEWVQITQMANQSNTMRYPGYDDSVQSGGASAIPYSTRTGYIYPWADSTNTFDYVDYSGTSNDYGAPTMCIYITGSVPDEAYDVEICQHIEYIGVQTAALSTPSDIDEKGRDTVVTALQDMYARCTGNKLTAREIGAKLKPSLIRIAQAAAPVATSIVMAALG